MDDKRIQQAATKSAESRWIRREEYAEHIAGFKNGAAWFKENLWHNPDEEPHKNEQCLVDMEFMYEDAPEDNYRTFITSTYGKWGWTEDSMPSEATNYKLHRWCYIKDLLKGDKHE